MHYSFKQAQDHLRAELFGRQTIEETLTFVDALTDEAQRHAATRFLVWVRTSRPIFKVERLSGSFKQLASRDLRIALLADSEEVRAFRDEARALAWLRAQSQE